MVLFPYNAMFSVQPAAAWHTDTYAIKLDDSIIHITAFPYWKKDFLEMSLRNYALYRQQGQVLYMHQYLAANSWLPKEISNKLVPQKKEAIKWPGWYLHYAGYKSRGEHRLDIIHYRLNFEQGKPTIEDSSVILTQQINIR